MTKTAAPRVRIEPRGLGRVDAAAYIGISPAKFDQLVDDGRMPRPRRADGRILWDRFALDDAFERLPSDDDGLNPLDAFLRQ
ncbi:XRE family transcriptional regulator [Asticcacaulis sp.]|uniref:XRE family transcriptional regulator n=1 Tax=Asticcacaulis sp. TaxID=1872648 RepID=UPI00391CFDDF